MNARADSPIKSGRDLIDRLRKDPQSVEHRRLDQHRRRESHDAHGRAESGRRGPQAREDRDIPGRRANRRRRCSAVTSTSSIPRPATWSRISGRGKLRPLAVSAPQRLGGVFATVPTWKEQGVNAVSSSWRGLMGPRGMTPEQIAYWDRVLGALVKTDDWKKDLADNFWDEGYADARDGAQAARRGIRRIQGDPHRARRRREVD